MKFTPLNGPCQYLTGACLDRNDAAKREKYLKNLLWKNIFKEKAQILFNRVNQESDDNRTSQGQFESRSRKGLKGLLR